MVKGNERPLKVYLYISMRIEKKGRINTRTRKHLPMKQCIFPSGFPIRSSNVDRNVQHKKYRIINDDDDGQDTSGNDIDYQNFCIIDLLG